MSSFFTHSLLKQLKYKHMFLVGKQLVTRSSKQRLCIAPATKNPNLAKKLCVCVCGGGGGMRDMGEGG